MEGMWTYTPSAAPTKELASSDSDCYKKMNSDSSRCDDENSVIKKEISDDFDSVSKVENESKDDLSPLAIIRP